MYTIYRKRRENLKNYNLQKKKRKFKELQFLQAWQGFYARQEVLKISEHLVSQTNSAKRPLTILQKSTKKKVTVRLKNEVEYKGKMDNVDSYMNLIMTDAEELHDGKTIANYGRVIVRGNNVLFIKLENEL